MKSLFITYNQILSERVMRILDRYTIRGYTLFPITHGRGSVDGEPHMGSHAWPAINSTIIAVCDEQRANMALEALRELDKETQMQGLRAYVWDITDKM